MNLLPVRGAQHFALESDTAQSTSKAIDLRVASKNVPFDGGDESELFSTARGQTFEPVLDSVHTILVPLHLAHRFETHGTGGTDKLLLVGVDFLVTEQLVPV